MSNDTTQHTPADVRGRIIRASILPIEDEETMIASLRSGAEGIERGELDVDDFVGVWSQYLRQLLRASSVSAPADVRERVAREVFTLDADWRREYWDQFRREFPRQAQAYYDTADRILALLRTPRGEGGGGHVVARLRGRARGIRGRGGRARPSGGASARPA